MVSPAAYIRIHNYLLFPVGQEQNNTYNTSVKKGEKILRSDLGG